jgi:hypothetical protein
LNLNIDLSKDELGPIGASPIPIKKGGQKLKIKIKAIENENWKNINT